ncbi:hypothetical protein [Sphingomonas sp. 3-13AW]|uniref:hypothetical protein n=1 Tax=Sphingomonas sp. 3-13AW TaxID=3050450 RepID=UPI003BB6C486
MISNQTRRFYAEHGLTAYLEVKGESQDGNASIIDLITDLLHLATHDGHDPDAIVRMALMHREGDLDSEDPAPGT